MTIQFADMAPPGAAFRPAMRWATCPVSQRLVMHWDRPSGPIPVQPEPAPAIRSLPVVPRSA